LSHKFAEAREGAARNRDGEKNQYQERKTRKAPRGTSNRVESSVKSLRAVPGQPGDRGFHPKQVKRGTQTAKRVNTGCWLKMVTT